MGSVDKVVSIYHALQNVVGLAFAATPAQSPAQRTARRAINHVQTNARIAGVETSVENPVWYARNIASGGANISRAQNHVVSFVTDLVATDHVGRSWKNVATCVRGCVESRVLRNV